MLAKHSKWLFPVAAMIVIAPFTPWLDLFLADYFDTFSGIQGHHFVRNTFTEAFFEYGVIPAQIVAILATVFYGLSFISPFWKRWRSAALVLILTMAVGEGFIVHVALKDQWGRPRPKQVEQFGGRQEFRPFFSPNIFNQPEPSKSFPCGHCGMGYYFFTFAVLGMRYGRRWMTFAGFAIGTLLGSLIGIARMAQGGHFLSDVLFSALIIWLSALAFDWLIFDQQEESRQRIAT